MIMRRCVWVLAGTIILSLSALLSLTWLMSSSPLVAHADPVDIPRKSTTNVPPDGPIKQAATGSCIEIDSDIAVSTTWTASCYRIMTSTVTVYDGAVLTIAPDTSTRVEFQDGAQLQVFGNLQALGAATRPITFTSVNTTSPGRGDWIGIILEDDGGGDVIQYSTIEYANTGVKVNDEDDVSIVSNTFRYNGGSGSTSGAIGGDIDSSHIANNRIHSCTNGMALTEAGHNTIISNTIEDMDEYGILLFEGGVGGGRDNEIVDNVIDRCTRGGLRLEAGDNNQVFSNTIYLNPGGGIHLDEQALTSVQHNYVYSNGGGSDYRAAVLITNTTFLSDISHNVVYDEYAEAIEYDDNNGSVGGPIASNALCSIPSFELRNGVAAAIDAPTNWWSTNTPTDSVSGLVDFTPWIRLSLAGTADGGITVALQDPSGNTVPPTAHRLTDPPAPNARRIELASNWGTPSPAVVLVNDAGTATSTLLPEATPGPDTIVITATDFCGYAVTGTVELPNLAITKTAAVTQVAAGDVLTYLISFANTGLAPAIDVRITDTLPTGATWVGDTAVANGWTRLATAPPTWFTPTLSPGAHGSFVLSVTVSPATCGLSLTNRATIGTPTLETSLDDNVSHSPPVTVVCADLVIAKFAHPPEGPPDAPIHFTIVYTNENATAADATITDWLPQNTTYLTDTSGLVLTRSPGRLTWTVPSLAPNESDSFTITLSYTSTVCPATLTNTVAISSAIPDLTPEDNVYTATYRVVCNVDLVVVKDDDVGPVSPLNAFLTVGKRSAVGRLLRTASEQTPLTDTSFGLVLAQHREFVREGDLVTYTIAVVNTGSFTATDVVLVETIPEHTDYVGIGWTHVTTRTYTQAVGTLAPGDGRIYYMVVRVRDVVPAGVDNLVNRVCGWSDETDVYPDDNCNYEDTPVYTDLRLYVANRHSGTVDVFNTTDFGYVKTITLGVNPYGMAVSGDYLFVADFAEDGAHGSVHVVDLLSDTVIASTAVGAHPVHVAAYDGHVYVAGHSGPPPITVIRADAPWDVVAEMYLDRHLTYEFGFFGATADESRGCVYLTKPDFGSEGVWRLTPVSTTWTLDYVYPTDATQSQNLRSILYHPTTDRVYSAIGLIDELWVFDPDSWELVERIPTGHQDPTNPGYGAHGLAALGQCVFVSNYLDESVTAVVDGSCAESLGPGSAAPPAGPFRAYLPAVGKHSSPGRRIVTIPMSGRPEGMVGVSNLLFVTLSHEDRVAIINTETLTVIDEIHVQGDYPHTVILAGGNYLNRGP
jgi:uncharacterized repeat protein (TIGR01451 family)